MSRVNRRAFLGAAATLLARPTWKPAFAALPRSGPRSLDLHNLHTGEKLALDYWVDGRYQVQALASVNHLLRDFRTGEVHMIAPSLLDLLATLRARLETSGPFEVISGYRSPATNAILRASHEHSGVAVKSLHMQGMAIDIRVPGRPLANLRDAALTTRGGGVGYYPSSDFVHVDVGPVRRW